MSDWQPTASRQMLAMRSALLAQARRYFDDHGVLAVDTPVVVNAPVTDVHIHSARVLFSDADRPYFLHTSPEYAMKRLLAAGSGDIYQICHVVRSLERGRQHNAEFTLIEWYRIGFTLEALMTEVDTLMRHLLGDVAFTISSERLTYREAFLRELHLDPFTATLDQLLGAARSVGYSRDPALSQSAYSGDAALSQPGYSGDRAPRQPAGADQGRRDEVLELLMGTLVGPNLGRNALTFIYNYPATQAALARLNPDDPRTALRFELYCKGIELANGFHELASPSEQRARFEQDNEERRRLGMPAYALDERLLSALECGLPDCAGVALGFDRTLMLAAGAAHIDAVLAFPTERA